MVQLRVALLGSPRVECGGAHATFDTRKATALLAYLAVTGLPQARDSLAGLLWPDHEQAKARGALRRTLSVLNSATGGDVVTADRSIVTLRFDRVWLDVTDFVEHATPRDHGHQADSTCPRCVADLESAAGIYRDEFMAGFSLRDSPDFDDWQAFQAHALQQQLAGVLARLSRARARAGELDAALESARRWLSLDPLQEPAHAMLIRLYAWTDQRSNAMRQYRDCVRILHRELGVPPLSQTTALDAAVRSGRLRPPRPAERRPVEKPRPAAARPGPSLMRLPLVGRDDEVARVEAARTATSSSGRLVVLSGEAGIGKSRLLDELISSARDAGSIVATARCHQGEEGLAFGVVADLLRTALRADASPDGTVERLPETWQVEVARLVPELAFTGGLPQGAAVDSPGAQRRLYAALVAALEWSVRAGADSTACPGVLAVEDCQWADDSSAEVLSYLMHRLPEYPLLLVLTWRPHLLLDRSPLHNALSSAVREGLATVLQLGPLDEDAVSALAAALPSLPLTDEVVDRLRRETGGLPLLVVEYLQSFLLDGRVPADEEWRLPGGVRDLLQVRLEGLSEMAQQVLAAAAVLNNDIRPALLRPTSGRSEDEVVAALEEAAGRAIIVETARSTYEFSHEATRRLVYEATSLARRRLLHSRAADALSQVRDADTAAARVATHFRRAGRDREGAEWFWRAAARAIGLYAHTEALEHLRAAAALGHPGHLVHQLMGDVLTALGRYREALLAYEQAAATCPIEQRLALATIEHRLAEVHHRLGSWDIADSHLVAALDLLTGADAPALHARVLADVALVAHRRGDAARAASMAERALAAAATAGDDAALAQAHDVLGVLASQQGHYVTAERHLRDSLDHAMRLAEPGYRVAALNNLALLEAAAGRPDEAIALAREALRLGLEHGDRHRAAALHTNLADLLHAAGGQEEALEHLTMAARLFAAVDDVERRRPEIWKLASW